VEATSVITGTKFWGHKTADEGSGEENPTEKHI